jgi:uncharacterized protein YkwD
LLLHGVVDHDEPWKRSLPMSKIDLALSRQTARGAAAALLVAAGLFSLACSDSSSPTAPSGAVSLDQVESSSMALVNGERGGAGLDQLVFDPVLCEIARSYSQKMRSEGFVSHFDASGAAVDSRLRSAGVTFRMAGENIAALGDTRDPAGAAHRGFMGSASHRANILGSRYTNVGVGVATDGESYWITQIFIQE